MQELSDKNSNFIPLASIDTEQVETLFQQYVFQALHEKGLITEETIINISTWQNSDFSVFAGETFNNQEQRLFLARYLKKYPVAINSLKLENNGLDTTITITKQLDDGEQSVSFSPLEFLAKLQQHIPNTWKQSVRYFGTYSARTRGAKKSPNQETTTTETTTTSPILPLSSATKSQAKSSKLAKDRRSLRRHHLVKTSAYSKTSNFCHLRLLRLP
ncbi:MAG: transposase [Deltaproteobacteria bacterium]|nr:transposase [Deltaproteobacteria bacterium]